MSKCWVIICWLFLLRMLRVWCSPHATLQNISRAGKPGRERPESTSRAGEPLKQYAKGEFTLYPFQFVFLRFCFCLKKYAFFYPHLCKSRSELSSLLHIDKDFDKNFVCERLARYFKIQLYPFRRNFLRWSFVQNVTAWLVRTWIYEN